jgi:hypothetical protein
MVTYLDLSNKHGHRDDHGFACGAEFNVKIRRRINIPDFAREQFSETSIDTIWQEEAGQSRDALGEALRRRYKWIGGLSFVGRNLGWLAIEDTECKQRNWEVISKIVEKRLKSFIKMMEGPAFWTEVVVNAKKTSAQLEREIAEALSAPLPTGSAVSLRAGELRQQESRRRRGYPPPPRRGE